MSAVVGVQRDAPWRRAGGRVALSAASVLAGLLIWQVLSTQVIVSIVFPPATTTLATLWTSLTAGALGGHLVVSLQRILVGFAAGSLVGASLGLLMGSFGLVRKFFDPYINFFRFITPIAWISPAVIWFGVGEGSKFFLIIYATMFIVLVNTMAGVAHIHRDRVRMARAFGARPWQVFRYITLPGSVGFILQGMRIGMGNSFMTVIGAEMLAASNGVGFLVYSARVFFEADLMFAGIVTFGVLGFLADRLFALAQRRVFWRYQPGR